MLEGLCNVGLRNSHRVLKRSIIEVNKSETREKQSFHNSFIWVLDGALKLLLSFEGLGFLRLNRGGLGFGFG